MSAPRPDPDFRPDPGRSIFVTGPIDESTIDRITPEIVRLLGSDAPITVYIDSPGGSTYYAENLNRSLRMIQQDGRGSNRIITAGLNMAASAASDLLIAGDYAIVQPHTVVLCHGVRQASDGSSVTHEAATNLARSLAMSNEQYALQTASSAISRFIFRVVVLRSEFPAIREAESERAVQSSDASCFITALNGRISNHLLALLRQALINRLGTELIDLVAAKQYAAIEEKPKTKLEFEAMLLKCIIDREVEEEAEDEEASFRARGLSEIQAKFEVLVNSHGQNHQAQIDRLVATWGESFLDQTQREQLAQTSEEERPKSLRDMVEPTIQSLWFFFVAVCRLLQENDNYLSAEEAYWMGLVDEIAGRNDLPSPRLFVEYASLSDNEEPTPETNP
jgi:ATP-dependent protease ClpP protease subunit